MSPLVQLGLVALGLYGAGWLSRKLGLSPVVGYLLLGVLLGPYGLVTLYPVTETTELLAELGLVLLLFFMGLEFSLSRFVESGPATVRAGLLDLLNFAVGFALGLAFGLGWLAALFLGGIVYVSSSGVIAKLLSERDLVAYPEAERTLGVLVFEDLAMIVILGGLGLLTSGGGWLDFLGVAVFLAVYGLLLRWGRRSLDRLLSREQEALVMLALALVILFSMGALQLGFPEAVAAFLLGMMLGESRERERLEEVLHPWYDVAAAVFFLDVGLHLDLVSALPQLPLALLLVAVTVLANLSTGFLGGRLSGLSRRASIGHGLMLLPRGEFSLVIASLAVGVSVLPEETRTLLVNVTSLYVLVMVVLGSLVFGHYDRINAWLVSLLKSRQERELEAERQRELDAVSLD